mgnify:FL=1
MGEGASTTTDVKGVVFDMDGTLLNTLPDLTALTNTVLSDFGYQTHTEEAIRGFIGDGVRALMMRAMPDSASDDEKEAALAEWKSRYQEFGRRKTVPYPNIIEMLEGLKSKGVKLGVLSNKFDAAVKDLAGFYFPATFDVAKGESPTCPRKPDPTGLLASIQEIGLNPSQVAYVGDSAGDIKTAKAAGVMAIGVSWGYQSVDRLVSAGADMVIDDPLAILDLA